MAEAKTKPRRRGLKVLLVVLGLLAVAAGGGYLYVRGTLLQNNSKFKKNYYLLIPHGSDIQFVANQLEADSAIVDKASFLRAAEWMKYDQKVKPGRYQMPVRFSNRSLISKLRSGDQSPVKLRFGSHWTVEEVADDLGRQLECGAQPFKDYFLDAAKLDSLGFNRQTLPAMLIPNTYEVWWTESPEGVMKRLKREHERFFEKPERVAGLKAQGLTPIEASTLASIVQSESDQISEWPIIAGLYLNRLRIGMPLQADPTVKFAVGDHTLKRILNRHLETESPYNTYKVLGLPPGPIKNPEPQAIDAVLNPTKHEYLYMCAKADFSGTHNFATTLSQHNRNAEEYQKALNRLHIR
jgi:UPF0755 protein